MSTRPKKTDIKYESTRSFSFPDNKDYYAPVQKKKYSCLRCVTLLFLLSLSSIISACQTPVHIDVDAFVPSSEPATTPLDFIVNQYQLPYYLRSSSTDPQNTSVSETPGQDRLRPQTPHLDNPLRFAPTILVTTVDSNGNAYQHNISENDEELGKVSPAPADILPRSYRQLSVNPYQCAAEAEDDPFPAPKARKEWSVGPITYSVATTTHPLVARKLAKKLKKCAHIQAQNKENSTTFDRHYTIFSLGDHKIISEAGTLVIDKDTVHHKMAPTINFSQRYYAVFPTVTLSVTAIQKNPFTSYDIDKVVTLLQRQIMNIS